MKENTEYKYSKEIVEALKNPFNFRIFLGNFNYPLFRKIVLLDRKTLGLRGFEHEIAEKIRSLFTNSVEEAAEKKKFPTEYAVKYCIEDQVNLDILLKLLDSNIFYFDLFDVKTLYRRSKEDFRLSAKIFNKLLSIQDEIKLKDDFVNFCNNYVYSLNEFIKDYYPIVKEEVEDIETRFRLLVFLYKELEESKRIIRQPKYESLEYKKCIDFVFKEMSSLDLRNRDITYLLVRVSSDLETFNKIKAIFAEDLSVADLRSVPADTPFGELARSSLLRNFLKKVDKIILSNEQKKHFLPWLFKDTSDFFEKALDPPLNLSMTDLIPNVEFLYSYSQDLEQIKKEEDLFSKRLKLFLNKGGKKFSKSALEDLESFLSSTSIRSVLEKLPSFYLEQLIKEDRRLIDAIVEARPELRKTLVKKKKRLL